MRVGVIGPGAEDDFAANVADGLTDLGLAAVKLGSAVAPSRSRTGNALAQVVRRHPRVGPRLERHLVDRVKAQDLDVVLTVVSLRPETVTALRASGTRVALWFPDAVANLGPLWMFDAPYDGMFFKEPVLVRRLNAMLSLPVHYLPEACNPRIHRPVSGAATEDGSVVVVGNLHPIRARLLERLVEAEIPLAIYGPARHADLHPTLRPLHRGRYVRGLEKSAVFGSAAAVLNNLHPAEIEGINCRVFEATAAGGAVVSETRPALEAHFQLGDEVLGYSTFEELLEHLRSLLADRPAARRLGQAASTRSLGEYTYALRLTSLLEKLL